MGDLGILGAFVLVGGDLGIFGSFGELIFLSLDEDTLVLRE